MRNPNYRHVCHLNTAPPPPSLSAPVHRPRGCAVHPGHCGDLLVLEMHQRLLLVGLPGEASQDCAWAATCVRHLRAELRPATHPEDPRKDPHGRAAVRLPPVRQGLCDKERLESARPRPHGRQAAPLRPVRFPVEMSVGREEARGGRAHEGVPPHVRAVWERVYQAVLSEGTLGKAAHESRRAGVVGGCARTGVEMNRLPPN
ncbi:unnamed protein product [Ixodes pacificus]